MQIRYENKIDFSLNLYVNKKFSHESTWFNFSLST